MNCSNLCFYVVLVAFPRVFPTTTQEKSTQRPNSLQNIIAGMEEADIKLNAIYNLNVFYYFDFGDNYPDTDLKKEVFKKTPEYAKMLAELKEKKGAIPTNQYYVKLEHLFESNTYDIKRKGFVVTLGENFGQGTISARAPKSVNGFLFPSLPTKIRQVELLGPRLHQETLFLPMKEEAALEIENNPQKAIVYFIFQVSGKRPVQFNFMDLIYGWYNMTHRLLYSNSVRVLVANEETGVIYFDKVYKSK